MTNINLSKNVWIVIPAYCEEKSIEQVVKNVRKSFKHIIVVDGDSHDATFENAKKAGAVVLKHAINCGQGAALQTGITYAHKQGAQFIATFDADGQHNSNDLVNMSEVLIKGGFDIVLGSRFLDETSNTPFTRIVLLKVAILFTWLTSGVRLSDVHNGLRVMTANTAAKLNIQQSKMAHASEIISIIKDLKFKFTEAPVTIRYTSYSLAKGQRFWHSFEIIKELIVGKLIK